MLRNLASHLLLCAFCIVSVNVVRGAELEPATPPAGYLGPVGTIGLDNPAVTPPYVQPAFRDQMSGTGPHFKKLAVSGDQIVYVDVPAPATTTPEFELVRDIRVRQRELASAAGVEYVEFDLDGRSVTRIEGLPPELEGIVAESPEQVLSDVVPELYKYYGFSGTEELRYEDTRDVMGYLYYEFIQFINDIPTQARTRIYVDPETQKLKEVSGTLHLDRGYETPPSQPREEAIDAVWDYVSEQESTKEHKTYDLSDKRKVTARVVYDNPHGLVPQWRIGVPTLDPNAPHEFRILSDGTVHNVSVMIIQ